jgi:CMP-N,N'-diacetyllegionaminic acid synthase
VTKSPTKKNGVLALIPARGGSKGIYRKNIKLLGGRPLIDWSIRAAKESSCIDRLIVSTDDLEIAEVAEKCGAEVPFLRPAELATDETPGIAPVLHALQYFPDYEWVLLLQPTSPFRKREDIDGIFRFCKERSASSAVSVCEVSKHPYLMYKIDDSMRIHPFIPDRPDIPRRQDFPLVHAINGALYLVRTNWFLLRETLVDSETLGYEMPTERSLDLDTLFDWKIAEGLLEVNAYD